MVLMYMQMYYKKKEIKVIIVLIILQHEQPRLNPCKIEKLKKIKGGKKFITNLINIIRTAVETYCMYMFLGN